MFLKESIMFAPSTPPSPAKIKTLIESAISKQQFLIENAKEVEKAREDLKGLLTHSPDIINHVLSEVLSPETMTVLQLLLEQRHGVPNKYPPQPHYPPYFNTMPSWVGPQAGQIPGDHSNLGYGCFTQPPLNEVSVNNNFNGKPLSDMSDSDISDGELNELFATYQNFVNEIDQERNKRGLKGNSK